jgi:hypothetical protein
MLLTLIAIVTFSDTKKVINSANEKADASATAPPPAPPSSAKR